MRGKKKKNNPSGLKTPKEMEEENGNAVTRAGKVGCCKRAWAHGKGQKN